MSLSATLPRRSRRTPARLAVSPLIVASSCVVVGAGVGAVAAIRGVASGRLAQVVDLPLGAVVALVAAVALIPLVLRDWRVGVAAFFVWLPFEDLVRKYSGNDIRVFLVKDGLFALALLGVSRQLIAMHAWRSATGRARISLALLIGWAVAVGVPAALHDPRVPIAGLRLDFLYAPLVAVGWMITTRDAWLSRTLRWLTFIAVGVGLLGVVQAVIGPTFLAPARDTPGLIHLVLVRHAGTAEVYRPTGTFVDPGRFASMALVALTLALVVFSLRDHRRRRPVLALCIGLGAVAVYAAGGKAALLLGAAVTIAAVIGPRRGRWIHRLPRAIALVVLAAVALSALGALFPDEVGNRLTYYTATLNPASKHNEWALRWHNYSKDAAQGIRLGGLTGRGTGSQSLGLQYLYGGEQRQANGLYAVESGYGSIAIELGVIGLGLWLTWSILWWLRLRHSSRSAAGTPYAAVATILNTWLFFLLFVDFFAGLQTFQNYVSNAYFWLFSGVVFGLPAAAARWRQRQLEAVDATVAVRG